MCVERSIVVLLLIFLFNELEIFVIDKYLVRIAVCIVLVLWLGTVIVLKFQGLKKKWVKYFILLMEILGIGVLSIFMSYHIVIGLALPFLMAAHYSNKKVTFYTYIISAICVIASIICSYQFGLSDLNMFAFGTGSIINEGPKFAIEVEPLSVNVILRLLLLFGLPRCIVLYLYSVMSLSIAKRSKDIQDYSKKVIDDSKIDNMTGLYNKNAYIQTVDKEIKVDARIGVVYFDLNGLKSINDKYGHEKGDELIIKFSKSIKKIIDEDISGYRIGGDEFVILVDNASDERMKAIIEEWKSALNYINTSVDGHKCEAAFGYSYGIGKEIVALIEEADKNMY